MESFFTKQQTQSKSRPGGKALSCVTCGLYKECNTPRMEPYGNFKKKILNIGEAPGEMEDKVGLPWQGKAGKLLQKTYKKLGIDLFEDCLNINSVFCRPSDKEHNNRAPSSFEVECCRRRLLKVVEEYKPSLIIILGNSGLLSLLGHKWPKDLGGISKWRGWQIPEQDYKTWICPTFHPSFILRNDNSWGKKQDDGNVEEVIWMEDLREAFKLIGEFEYKGEKFKNRNFLSHKEPVIEYIEDLSILDKLEAREVAIDYETTGLKPHAKGHRIICASIAISENHAYVFMMPKSRKEKQPFIRLLANPKIGKIAQNMKFEETWSVVRLGQPVVNWVWDTMLMTHVMDNRPGVTGLKFQVYVQFGISDYSSDIAPYLASDDNTNGNAINKIDTLLERPGGAERLMKYCALDSIYEFRLAQKQRESLLPF